MQRDAQVVLDRRQIRKPLGSIAEKRRGGHVIARPGPQLSQKMQAGAVMGAERKMAQNDRFGLRIATRATDQDHRQQAKRLGVIRLDGQNLAIKDFGLADPLFHMTNQRAAQQVMDGHGLGMCVGHPANRARAYGQYRLAVTVAPTLSLIAGRRTGFVCRSLGSPGRTRTCDKSVNSRLLYQLSYRGSAVLKDGGYTPGRGIDQVRAEGQKKARR